MNTNDNRLKAHKLIDHIFQDLLPAHGMAQRPEQIQLSHRMLDAMQDGRIALCDAGTGIGKTYAYLAAATAASAFPTGQIARPIIISTSSIALQNAVLTEYLPLLSCVLMADGILTKPLKAVIRKGKSHYVCDERLDRRLRQVYPAKKNPEALTALRTLRETLDMDRVSHLSGYDRERVCVPQVCDCKQRDCRYQRFLKTCDKDQFLFQICNHNLLVADAIHRSEGKRPIFPEHSIIIVDEAHKLPETAQQMLGVTLAAEEIRNLILQLKEERYLLAAEMLEDSTGPLRRKLAQPREEAEPVEACLRLLTAPSWHAAHHPAADRQPALPAGKPPAEYGAGRGQAVHQFPDRYDFLHCRRCQHRRRHAVRRSRRYHAANKKDPVAAGSGVCSDLRHHGGGQRFPPFQNAGRIREGTPCHGIRFSIPL